MSVCLPPEGKQTVSGALAVLENRQLIESLLWKKISEACKHAELPIDEEAPDYVVAPSGVAPMGVFQLASEPISPLKDDDDDDDDQEEEADVMSTLFRGKVKEKNKK